MYRIDLKTRSIDINQNVDAALVFEALNKAWHHPMFRGIPFPFDMKAYHMGYVTPGGDWTMFINEDWETTP